MADRYRWYAIGREWWLDATVRGQNTCVAILRDTAPAELRSAMKAAVRKLNSVKKEGPSRG